jgi:hypothetical protein
MEQGTAMVVLLLTVACLSWGLAAWLPIQFSIATVFLFAGPHNWLEARYMLGRLPARAGRLFSFFVVSVAGVLTLSVVLAGLPTYLGEEFQLDEASTAYGIWNTAFLLWVATLVGMRSRTRPRFDAGWIWPIAFLLIAGNWLMPFAWNFALVYLHPCMALVLLDRELARNHSPWRRSYHGLLLLLPVFVLGLWFTLRDSPSLPGIDPISLAITAHAGDWFLPNVSSHFLVALHTFLEMLHYAVWVLVMPVVGLRGMPWKLETIPVSRRTLGWRRAVVLFLFTGLFLVFLLWGCFFVDYATTRQIYFLVATLHVLAEVPFLLRML